MQILIGIKAINAEAVISTQTRNLYLGSKNIEPKIVEIPAVQQIAAPALPLSGLGSSGFDMQGAMTPLSSWQEHIEQLGKLTSHSYLFRPKLIPCRSRIRIATRHN